MLKLLRADLARMWGSRCLWICAAGAFLINFINSMISGDMSGTDDGGIIDHFGIVIFVISIFVPLFLGTEYSGSTIRNKLIIGRTRTEIYFASLITVIIGSLVITAAGVSVSAVRLIAAGGFKEVEGNVPETPRELFGIRIAVCIFAVIAACAFYTLLGMLITKKSSGVVWAVFITILAYFSSPFIGAWLREPEMVTASRIQSDRYFSEFQWEKNSRYISGFPRAALGALYSDISFGSIDQAGRGYNHTLYPEKYSMYTEKDNFAPGEEGLWALPLYSLGTTAVVTAIGTALFRRKEIK